MLPSMCLGRSAAPLPTRAAHRQGRRERNHAVLPHVRQHAAHRGRGESTAWPARNQIFLPPFSPAVTHVLATSRSRALAGRHKVFLHDLPLHSARNHKGESALRRPGPCRGLEGGRSPPAALPPSSLAPNAVVQITKSITLERKTVDDVLGGAAAWENVDQTDG